VRRNISLAAKSGKIRRDRPAWTVSDIFCLGDFRIMADEILRSTDA